MKTTEIIEKVKQNLLIQEELKFQLENDEAKREIIEEKISYIQEKLANAEQNELVLTEDLIKDLTKKAEDLNNNLLLDVRASYVDDDLFGYGINAIFMNKKYTLTAFDYILASNKNPRILDVGYFADKILTDYMEKGKILFNENGLKSLKEIKRLYFIKPEIITDKLVVMDFDRKILKLQKNLLAFKEELCGCISELKEIEIELEKTKEFKSKLLKKIFTKKERLTAKRKKLLHKSEELNEQIRIIETKLADKDTIKADSIDYVQKELVSLVAIFNWVDSFEIAKEKLVKYRLEYIETLKKELHNLVEDKANTQTKIKETKGMLQLNKKVNNEIVHNALMNNDFVEKLQSIDSGKVDKSDVAAVKFVENKYHDYLQNCIEKLVK